jgi:hypothetical protein
VGQSQRQPKERIGQLGALGHMLCPRQHHLRDIDADHFARRANTARHLDTGVAAATANVEDNIPGLDARLFHCPIAKNAKHGIQPGLMSDEILAPCVVPELDLVCIGSCCFNMLHPPPKILLFGRCRLWACRFAGARNSTRIRHLSPAELGIAYN